MIELFNTGPSYLVRTELNLFEPVSGLPRFNNMSKQKQTNSDFGQ